MSEPNNLTNDYVRPFTNVCQSFYLDDFDFDDVPPIYQSSDNVDTTSMNIMNYENVSNYTGNYYYAPNQGNPPVSYSRPGSVNTMNGQLSTPCDQVETHTNNPYPLPGSFQTLFGHSPYLLPVSFQTLCGPSVPHSDTTNNSLIDNHSQHLGTNTNNTCISYIFKQMPTSNEYIVMREERTQSIVGRISAAASIGEMLALTQSEKEN
ncbi:7740_t:CDS:1 [Paraglomus brasilianum]|uniref:7740_t:CDS:1 n=1 Tax=Paraglomus brasilianum TaxID=144538 RepID=A0A9N9CIX2_9GLOM|nr:7740_t:CDS:1 [Paraglomus brasilianum]